MKDDTVAPTTNANTNIGSSDTSRMREKDLRMNSMKKLDQLSTTVLKNALRFTGKVQVVSPETKKSSDYADEAPAEHQPGVLIATAHDSKYVACFDPLDGSGNADAAICTGTIFGIFENNQYNETATSSLEQSALESVLQPGNSLKAAGYCLYSSATILVLSLGDGTHAFTLDPQLNEFVLTHTHMMIPQKGNVYSCNEANALGWTKPLQRYVNHLKEERYALRYVGSMVGDIHRTLLYGGIFMYPISTPHHPKGNLQLLYKSAPMGYLVQQAGGKCTTNGFENLLDVRPTHVHERSPCFIGSPDNIDELQSYLPPPL
jgi:fructose-1,6-bisphosphatase I